jgi:ubiquitin carboxyl-terminal hydrolase 4/11
MFLEIKTDDGTLKYDLFGCVNHFGNLGFGHYTAYAKNHIDGKWYNFDDSSVHQEDASAVCSPASYVLFYRRKDWNFPY